MRVILRLAVGRAIAGAAAAFGAADLLGLGAAVGSAILSFLAIVFVFEVITHVSVIVFLGEVEVGGVLHGLAGDGDRRNGRVDNFTFIVHRLYPR